MSEQDEFMQEVETPMADSQEGVGGRKRREALFWGGALVWAGLVFGADGLDLLPQVGDADPWSWVFFGTGLYGLLLGLYSLLTPSFSNPGYWEWIFAGGLTVVGLGGLVNIDIGFPLVLIVVGLVVLGSVFWSRS